MNKITYIIITLFTISFGIQSCGKTAGEQAKDSTALSIAILANKDNLPFYYADSMGIYKELGLNVEFYNYGASMDCDTAFVNREVDGVVDDIIKANIWHSNGDSIKVVMSGDLCLYLLTSRSARIKQITSLKEKIIAVTRNSSVDYVADLIMDSAKLSRLTLNRPQINDISLRSNMLNLNQYDGALMSEPYATYSEMFGANRILSSDELCGNLSAVIFHTNTINERRDDIQKLIKGYNIAVERLNKMVDDGNVNILTYLPTTIGEELPDSMLTFKHFNYASMPTKTIVRQTFSWAKERKLTKKDTVNYNDLVDSTFYKAHK